MQNTNSHFHLIEQDKAPEVLNLIVEISQGEANKYEYNKEYGILELDRVLYGPMFYPTNYCDVPQTWNEGDDDPLDAMLFSSYPITPGVLAKGRVIGMMEMNDSGEQDHKIICVNDADPRFDHVKSIDDLSEYQKKDIVTFFETYKIPQGKKVEIGKFLNAKEAYKFIKEAQEAYKEKFGE